MEFKFNLYLLDIFFTKNKKKEVQFNRYRRRLTQAKTIDDDVQNHKEYCNHLKALDEIQLAYRNKDFKLLCHLLDDEERYFGWTFISEKYGAKIETDFYRLKNLIISVN